MENGKTSKTSLASKPQTDWREPLRAWDNLLKLPRGRPLKPTEKLRQESSAVDSDADISAAIEDEAPTSVTDEAPTGENGKEVTAAPSEQSDEVAINTFDGTFEQTGEYVGDAEDGTEQSAQANISGVYAEGDQSTVFDALEDDELLVGRERDDEDAEEQQDTVMSSVQASATRTCVHQAKNLRKGTETIHPYPTDASKVVVTYQYTTSAGDVYVQETEMPEVVDASADGASEPGSIIVPDVELSKIPRTKKGSPWVPVPGTSRYQWTRGDGEEQETWRVVIFFRRLNRDTFKYQDMYMNVNMLNNIDPNDKKYRTTYNKWILQFARRRDATYTQKVARVHWNVAERRALYMAINAFCAKFGINKFGFFDDCKLSTKQLQLMADAVNAANNPLRTAPRGIDAIRGQILTAHVKAQPKNKAIFELNARAVALRSRIENGEVVPRAERKPQFAIPLAELPVDPPAAAVASGSKKRKHAAVKEESDEEPSSSELSLPPASRVGDDDGVSVDTWMTTDEEITPDESGEENWSDADEEVPSVEGEGEVEGDWVEIEEAAPSPPAKRRRM